MVLPKSRLLAVASGKIAESTTAVNVTVSLSALPISKFPRTEALPVTVKSPPIVVSSVTSRSSETFKSTT